MEIYPRMYSNFNRKQLSLDQLGEWKDHGWKSKLSWRNLVGDGSGSNGKNQW